MKNDDKANNGLEANQEASLYPYTSLAPSLKIADAVKELGGARSAVSKSHLAAHFSESEKSASFLQRISSAKAFGLISGRSDYNLSEAAKRYYSPTSEQDRSNALLEFLTAPKSFREIIRLFDGEQLPKREILGNIFSEKLNVPESWKDRAASFFENSAQFVGVIDENRFLRFKATQHTSTAQPALVHAASTNRNQPERFPPSVPEVFSLLEEHTLYLDKDKTKQAKFSCPLFISQAEYGRICNWIKATWIVEEEKKNEQL